MGGLAALLLSVFSSVGPNGYVLLPALDPAEVRQELPVQAFLEMAPRIWVVFHHHRDMMATYMPSALGPNTAESSPTGSISSASEPRPLADGVSAPDLSLVLLPSDAETERLLPGLSVPRVFLYAPYYLEDGRLKKATDMPLDVAQYFASSLLEASLDLMPPEGLEKRASSYGPEIPPGERPAAYVSALAQFGADAFSVATELRRLLARQAKAGKDPCKIIDHPGTLFAQWPRIFAAAEYRGLYRPAGPGSARWVLGPPITSSDKKFLLEQIFGNFWAGDMRQDFSLACRSEARRASLSTKRDILKGWGLRSSLAVSKSSNRAAASINSWPRCFVSVSRGARSRN